MKQYRFTKLLGWFAAAVLLLTTSCTDELFGTSSGKSGDVTVTFTLTPEAATTLLATRSGDDDDEGPHVTYPDNAKREYARIGDGSKADMLVYAVYDGDTDELLTGYSSGTDDGLDFEEGDGQTIKKVPEFPYTFTLSLKRDKHYKIAFWAQSSKTKAYDFSNLKKVEVKYGEIGSVTRSSVGAEELGGGLMAQSIKTSTPNNDEFRDVFCRCIDIETTGNSTQHRVLLYRPLTQINFGTSGYDFESITRNADKKYLFSKIRINRVARYFDVVEDEPYSTTTGDNSYTDKEEEKTAEAFAVADFGFAPIPAYANYRDTENVSRYTYPKYPSYTIWDWDHDNSFSFGHATEASKQTYEPEDFLKVNLYKDKKAAQADTRANTGGPYYTSDGYTTSSDGTYLDYANMTLNDAYRAETSNTEDLKSETFKYLSMCYVLTSSRKDKSIALNNVKVWLATDADGSDSIEIANILHVPAQRNWRTNIVGNLLTEENSFEVRLDKDFAGEYDGWSSDGEKWEWSGPLAKGVYYDAEKDEIQISDADGLRWFQRMVNGDLTIRWATKIDDSDVQVGKFLRYYYYDENDQIHQRSFEYKGYVAPENEKEKMRILKATGQDRRTGSDKDEWPTNNNFHFSGVTVKLMADIDLAGDEWIPIGFDFKNAEFVYNSRGEIKQDLEGGDKFADTETRNRGFYGTFDGNGHTISNLTTKRFSAQVDDAYYEQIGYPRNYDAFPWLGRGLFGSIGGNATIKNVRLHNVDILGCNGVGGIVGIAYGDAITIDGCIVDGGTLTATPMYRNDTKESRTFARGVYLGGIAGYFNTRDGVMTNCVVKNLLIKGYRRVGSLIGSIDKKYDGTDSEKTASQGSDKSSNPHSISNNSVSNTTVIASQLHFPFGFSPHARLSDKRQLFGWSQVNEGAIVATYDLHSGELIGGDTNDFLAKTLAAYCSNNVTSGVTFSKVTEKLEELQVKREYFEEFEKDTIRISEVHDIPLQYMPALSSWFTDSIKLYSNYYGLPSAHKINKVRYFTSKGTTTTPPLIPGSQDERGYAYPMRLPLEVEMAWDTNSSNVGVYVESVSLDGGDNPVGGRSVFTPTGVSSEGACCMYVTARNRAQASNLYNDGPFSPYSYAQPTIIRHVVLRGDPYAYAGLLLSPNKNMSKVVLDSVYIYDVYKTIALDDEGGVGNRWPTTADIDATNTEVLIKNSNLRGYTVLGKDWKKIDFENVTFEEGSYTRYSNGKQERTCKVEDVSGSGDGDKTTFKGCHFKAPYIIDLKGADLSKVEFNDCYATATSTKNIPIDISQYSQIDTIEIESKDNGDPQIIITGTLK